MHIRLILLFTLISWTGSAQNSIPVPSTQQYAWHNQEFYLFMHFGPNTFTGKEWGEGNEKTEIFNPTALDCRQWCATAKAAGAKGIIITAKHHDGFCLWPSKFSKHTVRESSWKNGKGDVLKELSEACKEYDLRFGVYLSPWDRNHPDYGTDTYNEVFKNMMIEIFRTYGPVWELWWDGANGEGPNGKKQVYDWAGFRETVRKYSPNTVVFSDVGPHIRWVGNERGIAGITNWNTLDTAGFTAGLGAPHVDTLSKGNKHGKAWIPAECDVSIRPGWFYRKSEDEKVKSPQDLFQLYLKSVGRGANFLLNVPPDQRGRIHEVDSAALQQFYSLRKNSFEKDLISKEDIMFVAAETPVPAPELADDFPSTYHEIIPATDQYVRVDFKKSTSINCISIMETILYGQGIESFEIILKNQQTEVGRIRGTTIGRKRILTFPAFEVSGFSFLITGSRTPARISEVSAYLIDKELIEKQD